MTDFKTTIAEKILNDKIAIWVVRISFVAILIAFIASYISFEIKGASGQHVKYLWVEYNIPNCDTFEVDSITPNEHNTQINQPNAPIHIGDNNN